MSDQRSGVKSRTALFGGLLHSAKTQAGNLDADIYRCGMRFSPLLLLYHTESIHTLLRLFEDSHYVSDKNTQLVSTLNVGVLGGHILVVPQWTPLSAKRAT